MLPMGGRGSPRAESRSRLPSGTSEMLIHRSSYQHRNARDGVPYSWLVPSEL